jgi:hypothetical protein
MPNPLRRRPISQCPSMCAPTHISQHVACYFGGTLVIMQPICVYLNRWNSL